MITMNAAQPNIINFSKIKNQHIMPANDACTPLLELKNVCKFYGEGKDRTSILKNINLDIRAGEFVAIVGFSGSGKTTLISLIAGLIQADSGLLLKQGQAITEPG